MQLFVQSQDGKGPEDMPNSLVTTRRHRKVVKLADFTEGKVVADYKVDIYYEPKESDHEIKLVKYKEEEVNPDAEKMELPCKWTIQQRLMKCKVS